METQKILMFFLIQQFRLKMRLYLFLLGQNHKKQIGRQKNQKPKALQQQMNMAQRTLKRQLRKV
jgi:hypothetical protein